jgi:hypothetical protein
MVTPRKPSFFETLADTYYLSAEEREVLAMIGRESDDEHAGKVQWAVDRMGMDFQDPYLSLCAKLDAVNDHEKMQLYGIWYLTARCPVPIPLNAPDLLMCPTSPTGCRRTMAIGMFPFWPVDMRCADCIKDKSAPERRREKVVMAGERLAELLKVSSSRAASVPKLNELIGTLVVKQGGVDAIAEGWHAAIEDAKDKGRPGDLLKHYNQLATLVKNCQEIEQNEQSILDKLADSELRDYIVSLLLQRLSYQQIQAILQDAADLPQQELGRLEYGQA